MVTNGSKLPQREREIIEDVKYFENKYFIYDEPIPFIDGLKIYPVNVRDYNEFLIASTCLTFNKYDDEDPKARSKSTIGYIIYKMQDPAEGQTWSSKFVRILELCLHIQRGLICKKCGKVLSFEELLCEQPDPQKVSMAQNMRCDCGGELVEPVLISESGDAFIVNGIRIDNINFNKMRKYIMYQNFPSFVDDTFVAREVRDDYAKKQQILSRRQGNATLERKICCLVAKSNYKFEDVYNMPIRKFELLLDVVNDAIEYEANRVGLMTGVVSLKDGQSIDHWIYKKEQSMYGTAQDLEGYVGKIQGA